MSIIELHEKKRLHNPIADTLTLLSAVVSGLLMAVFAMAIPAWILISL